MKSLLRLSPISISNLIDFFLNTIKIQLLTISMHFLGGPLYELKTAHTQ